MDFDIAEKILEIVDGLNDDDIEKLVNNIYEAGDMIIAGSYICCRCDNYGYYTCSYNNPHTWTGSCSTGTSRTTCSGGYGIYAYNCGCVAYCTSGGNASCYITGA